jgi:hypothetical protein
MSGEELAALKARVERIAKYESEYLLPFWSEDLQSFQISATSGKRVSVISTCSVVDLILKNRNHWKSHVSWQSNAGNLADTRQISLESITSSLLNTEWSYDAFQAPTLVKTLATMRAVAPGDSEKFVKAVTSVLDQRSRLSMHRKQEQSSSLRYHNVQALLALVKNNMIPPSIQESDEVSYAIERANLVAYDELSRQLAFHFSGDSSDFDVIVLAFSLLTYFETAESQFLWGPGAGKKSSSGVSSGVMGSANMALVKTALEVIFKNQFTDGTWRKGEAIQLQQSGGKRDIGNSYVFFFDIVSNIIKALPQEVLMPYIPNFERCLTWAENNVQKEMPPLDCDESGLCQGPMINGWKSNHVAEPTTTSWSTCSVFNFLDEFSHFLDVAQTHSVLDEFKGKSKEQVLQETGGRESWNALMDADLLLSTGEESISSSGDSGGDQASSASSASSSSTLTASKSRTLKDTLFAKLLLPQLQQEVEDQIAMLSPHAVSSALPYETEEDGERVMPMSMLRGVQDATSKGVTPSPLYSLILFGPPGTAKTTIAMSMASVINYNFVTIDTATFLADGLENVASRMSYIFDRLKSMSDTVILFDEIEEFCLDRENPNLAMESRMLTTAMLTQLNALRRDQKNIFIVATNRLRSFDAAVIRPGRFDLLTFVGTPNYDSRERRLRRRLLTQMSSIGATTTDVDAAMQVWSQMMKKDWDGKLRFLTYAENESLNAEVVSLVKAKALSESFLAEKLDSILATSTIQGPVMQDYLDTERLSRF